MRTDSFQMWRRHYTLHFSHRHSLTPLSLPHTSCCLIDTRNGIGVSMWSISGTYEYSNTNLPRNESSLFAHEIVRAFTAGSLAGLFEWSSGMPLDVIRQRIYSGEYTTFLGAARGIYATQGVRGFYLGFVPTIARAVPANGAAWIGLTQTEKWLSLTLD